jgi:acetylxylan esterase
MSRYLGRAHALRSTLTWRVAIPLAMVCGAAASAEAQSLTLVPTSGWQTSTVPSYISMYEYVPTTLASPPPILVAAHYCGGSAMDMFNFTGMAAIEAAARTNGFIMIFPQTTNPASSADCWDVGSTASLTHGGGGDTEAIAQMVAYEVSKRSANANRAYIMGDSSGAFLAEAMAAVYQEVFMGGSEFSGVPAGCWDAAGGWTAASNWANGCATGAYTMTAAKWGALALSMDPGYTGHRPRLQLWHGTADTTVSYVDMNQGIMQWTNVLLGLTPTPSSTSGLSTAASVDATSSMMFSGTDNGTAFTDTEYLWSNSCGYTVLEAFSNVGGGHNTPFDATAVIDFFGLNTPTGLDPEIAKCGDGDGGTGGGAGGTGGSSGGGGTGGSSAGGAGGSSAAGAGGSSAGGAGGSSAGGAGGSSAAGAGGSSSGGGGAAGGTGSGSGGSSGSTGAGGAGSGDGGTGSGGNNLAGGCSVTLQRAPGETGLVVAAGLFGAIAITRSRRRRRA